LTVIIKTIEDHPGDCEGVLRHAGNLYGYLEALSLASEARQEKDDFARAAVQLYSTLGFIFNFHNSTTQSVNPAKSPAPQPMPP
ncbi:hypothetical protein, partial [Pseudomonas sp.]|uniref:hypothetical protein n=1 Tax=Pseudomonas sp. TaxID=306 RepID=UPI003D6EF7C5